MKIPTDFISYLQNAKFVVVLTGAGVSQESGIPTFRDREKGLWAEFNSEDLATPQGFQKNPQHVTRWYDERRLQCQSVQPNAAHFSLAELEKHLLKRNAKFVLLTQNIDRLHQKSGSQKVLELHGSLYEWWCVQCGKETEEANEPFKSYPPKCECGGMKRPGVVWFGEELPLEVIRQAFAALRQCDLFFTIGTSAVVHPAAGFIHLARQHGAKTAEVNLEPTDHSEIVDWAFRGSAAEILPQLVCQAFGSV